MKIARTIGYLALIIIFVQIVPFAPIIRITLTSVSCVVLITIALSLSRMSREDTEPAPVKAKTNPRTPRTTPAPSISEPVSTAVETETNPLVFNETSADHGTSENS